MVEVRSVLVEMQLWSDGYSVLRGYLRSCMGMLLINGTLRFLRKILPAPCGLSLGIEPLTMQDDSPSSPGLES